MKKTIWILNMTAGKPDSGWGERHYNLSKYWVKKGYNVKIFSGSHNHLFIQQPKVSKHWITKEVVEDGIEFCWIKIPTYFDGGLRKFWSYFIFTLKLFFINTKIVEKPDIILVSSMPIFPIINAVYFKKKFKATKLIFEVRDLWPLTPIYLKGYSKNHPFVLIVSWFERYAYKKADFIVSLLPNAKEYITSISKDEKKYKYIPNGIEIDFLDEQLLETSIIEKIPQNKFVIGYAGTLGMANAMEYFIKASKEMISEDKIHFLIVGDGYLKEKFKQEVKESTNITFIDKVKKNQVQSILKHFDVCYLGRYNSPLYKYGVSYNKYFDYMLAKKIILESSNYIKDQVELADCGIIVKPESSQAIVEGIRKIYKMTSNERTLYGKRGYDYVTKFHSFSYLSNLYLKLFK